MADSSREQFRRRKDRPPEPALEGKDAERKRKRNLEETHTLFSLTLRGSWVKLQNGAVLIN